MSIHLRAVHVSFVIDLNEMMFSRIVFFFLIFFVVFTFNHYFVVFLIIFLN